MERREIIIPKELLATKGIVIPEREPEKPLYVQTPSKEKSLRGKIFNQKFARLVAAGAVGTAILAGPNPFGEQRPSIGQTEEFKKEPTQKEDGHSADQQKSEAQRKAEEKKRDEKAMIDALAKKADKESGTDREQLKENIKLIVDSLKERKIATPRVIAYAMATMETETAHTYKPVREAYYLDKAYGTRPGKHGEQSAINNGYSGGKDYYGRGYIQITHDYNYKKFDRALKMDGKLANNPDKALEPEVSADILAAFFDVNSVDKKAEKDFVEARKPINGTDKAGKIAKDAQKYLNTIKNS